MIEQRIDETIAVVRIAYSQKIVCRQLTTIVVIHGIHHPVNNRAGVLAPVGAKIDI